MVDELEKVAFSTAGQQ